MIWLGRQFSQKPAGSKAYKENKSEKEVNSSLDYKLKVDLELNKVLNIIKNIFKKGI